MLLAVVPRAARPPDSRIAVVSPTRRRNTTLVLLLYYSCTAHVGQKVSAYSKIVTNLLSLFRQD